MASRPALPEAGAQTTSVREIRRLETRARLFEAAIDEISARGLARADVTAITKAVGVVRGTFYFHFPTKEHVLVELQHREEVAVVDALRSAPRAADDLEPLLTLLVRLILDAGCRMGTVVFQDMLGMQFASSRPADIAFDEHPVMQYIMEIITNAQRAERVPANSDPRELALFFGTGLYALLAVGVHDFGALSRYVTTFVKGVENR
ncbi:TetR/AcrR family transcriptional regulator [Mycobacterium intracellulare]|uniref:TetR/AcrR family transcriptional regulator n=1 Tax=Mycobacterium intracellulare TaxID=1767 RepID=UPI000BAC1413|nr:TetR/AcrR family transcriptional regulator [Mycobacterium intracellulare]ASW98583.1 TetR family transcriptional regulator [Mycobacterium intracellulare subsp. chimaera]PBA61182.1 TetR family transcriptional regulator [Mycobacterium intracellulare subsp. chimaera]PBA61410.1 TetR family transcriptional regulator [Mycobacterium intracellulare subsp. chimaera]